MNRKWTSTEYIFYLIAIISPLGQCLMDFNTASFPQTAHHLNVPLVAVQNTLASYSIGFALGCFVWGISADYFGRRNTLLWGLALAFFSSIGSAFAPDIQILSATRFLQGLGGGSVCISLGGTLRSLFTGHELRKRTAYAALIGPVLFTLAPFVGSYAQYLIHDWRRLHVSSALLLFICWLAVWFIVPPSPNRCRIGLSALKNVLTHKGFHKNNAIFTLIILLYGAFLTLAPSLFLVTWKWDTLTFGFMHLGFGCLWILGAWINHRFQHRLTPEQWISHCLIAIVLGFLFLSICSWFSLNQPLMCIIGLSPLYLFLAPLFSHTFYRTFEPFPQQAGIAGAIYRLSQFLGYALGSWIIVLWPQSTFTPLALFGLLTLIIALLIHHLPRFQDPSIHPCLN